MGKFDEMLALVKAYNNIALNEYGRITKLVGLVEKKDGYVYALADMGNCFIMQKISINNYNEPCVEANQIGNIIFGYDIKRYNNSLMIRGNYVTKSAIFGKDMDVITSYHKGGFDSSEEFESFFDCDNKVLVI
jgi:hypothetical protein